MSSAPHALVLGQGAQAPPASGGGESGTLRTKGRVWRREDGSVFQARGMTMFALPGRMRAGQDISADVDWVIACGGNVARVFPDWTPAAAGRVSPGGAVLAPMQPWDGSNYNYDDPAFQRFMADDFLPYMKGRGVRCQVAVVVTYARAFDQMRRHCAETLEVLGADRFHLFQAVNEPWNTGIDAEALVRGLDRHGVLGSYGYKPDGDGGDGYLRPPLLDFGTWRSDRDPAHFYRSGNDSEKMWGFGVPVWDDEPCGAADYDRQGGGARNSRVADHVSHLLTASFYGDELLHSQCGLEGRRPAGDEPRTAQIGEAVARARAAVPQDVYTGEYSRNGMDTFPLAMGPADVVDDPHTTGYASLHGDAAYVVVPRPTPAFLAAPRLANGWTRWEDRSVAGVLVGKASR